MHNPVDLFPEHLSTVKTLSSCAWRDAGIDATKIERWLRNFTGQIAAEEIEQRYAFHLMAQLIYFGKREISECLKVLYQEKILYPFVQECLIAGVDAASIGNLLIEHLKSKVRFVGVGGPSESGNRILYDFRVANNLPTGVMSSVAEIVEISPSANATQPDKFAIKLTTLTELNYLDDFCATGEQVERREKSTIEGLRAAKKGLKINFLLLFATKKAVEYLISRGLFDRVEAVMILDDDYKVFGQNSHFFRKSNGIDYKLAKEIMVHYGAKLTGPSHALGFRNSQMLMSFEHNTPDNTLSVIWKSAPSVPWYPIFPRKEKVELP